VGGEIFRTCPDRPWGPPSLLYNVYRVFPRGKERPGRDADPSPPSSAVGHERVKLYLYSPYGPYSLYRASVPVQMVHCTFTFTVSVSGSMYIIWQFVVLSVLLCSCPDDGDSRRHRNTLAGNGVWQNMFDTRAFVGFTAQV
jgi:hypothetical protein